MKKNVFEIYLTSQYVDKTEWIKLFYKISKINGMLKTWNLWIYIEKNYIRYFIETRRMLPPVLGELGEFLFKKVDINLQEKAILQMPHILISDCKTVLDVYDRNESKRNQKLKKVNQAFLYFNRYTMYLYYITQLSVLCYCNLITNFSCKKSQNHFVRLVSFSPFSIVLSTKSGLNSTKKH